MVIATLLRSIGKFERKYDDSIITLVNEITNQKFDKYRWKRFVKAVDKMEFQDRNSDKKGLPAAFWSLRIENDQFLRNLGPCNICHSEFGADDSLSLAQFQICDYCHQTLCCGYIEYAKNETNELIMCYRCLESICIKTVDQMTDLEPYYEEEVYFKLYLEDKRDATDVRYKFNLSSDEINILLQDNLTIKKNINTMPIPSYYESEFTKLSPETHWKFIAWKIERQSSSTILIEGIQSNSKHIQFKYGSSVRCINLNNSSLLEVDLTPLKYCKSLKILNLQNNQLKLIDLIPIGSCRKLSLLDLSKNSLSDIDLSSIKSIKRLKTLNLTGNCLSKIDLLPLTRRKHGTLDLFLNDNDLTKLDLQPLETGTNIERLHVAGNKLQEIDLSPLKKHERIKSIDLGRNEFPIIDLTPLSNLSRLQVLGLEGISLANLDLKPIKDLKFLIIKGINSDILSIKFGFKQFTYKEHIIQANTLEGTLEAIYKGDKHSYFEVMEVYNAFCNKNSRIDDETRENYENDIQILHKLFSELQTLFSQWDDINDRDRILSMKIEELKKKLNRLHFLLYEDYFSNY